MFLILTKLTGPLLNINFMACEKSFFNRYDYHIKCSFENDKLHLSFTGLTK
jgi:hypothetical protein